MLVHGLGLGVIGIALATCATNVLNAVILTLYCTYKDKFIHKESWHFLNRDSFSGIIEYLEYAIPATIMRCLEYWCFEVLVIYAGWIGSTEQGAAITVFHLFSVCYRIPNGISMASTNLIGSSLGANLYKDAKKYSQAAFLLVLVVIVFVNTNLIVFRYQLPKIFTYHEEMIEVASRLLIVFTFIVVGDFIQGCQVGSMLAMGLQKYGSYINILSYLGLTLPMSYILAFYFDLGVYGVYIGAVSGSSFAGLCYLIVVQTANWEKLAQEISLRLNLYSSKLQNGENSEICSLESKNSSLLIP